jgi:hypothetical protein
MDINRHIQIYAQTHKRMNHSSSQKTGSWGGKSGVCYICGYITYIFTMCVVLLEGELWTRRSQMSTSKRHQIMPQFCEASAISQPGATSWGGVGILVHRLRPQWHDHDFPLLFLSAMARSLFNTSCVAWSLCYRPCYAPPISLAKDHARSIHWSYSSLQQVMDSVNARHMPHDADVKTHAAWCRC